MNRLQTTAAAVVAIGLCGPALAQDDADTTQQAVDALDAMASHLRSLEGFKLTAIGTSDAVLDNGQKVQIQGQVDYDVVLPDRLKAYVATDTQERVYYYDGSTVTQYAPNEDVYATVDAPGTIAETVQALETTYGLKMPLADLFLWGSDKAPDVTIETATYAGRSTILGDRCDHYAYRVEGADVQVWIRAEGEPLPCRLVVTDLTNEARPEYEATLIWNTDTVPGTSIFSFSPPAGADEIEQARLKTEE